MNAYIKIIITIALSSLCISTMAANTFIVKYKLTESQKAFLSFHSGSDSKKTEAKIRAELAKDLSLEQLDALSKAADVKIDSKGTKIRATDSYPLAIGAHVITLSEDLDKIQTKQFISNVEQNSDVEYIEEDRELYSSKIIIDRDRTNS